MTEAPVFVKLGCSFLTGELLFKVDTFPPERMRRRLAPTIPEKLTLPLGGGTMVELMVIDAGNRLGCCQRKLEEGNNNKTLACKWFVDFYEGVFQAVPSHFDAKLLDAAGLQAIYALQVTGSSLLGQF